MRIEAIPLTSIDVGQRLRPVNDRAVDTLVESMSRLGQLQPITVYKIGDSAARLVAGRHRYEAAKRLAWAQIDTVIVDGTEIDCELREIAENLHRAELTALERDEQVARWIELTTAKLERPSYASQLETHKKRGQKPGGVNAAARDLGIAKPDAHRAVKVASISSEAKRAVRDAGMDDNRSALLAVAKEATPEAQVAKVNEIAARKAVKPPEPPSPVDIDDGFDENGDDMQSLKFIIEDLKAENASQKAHLAEFETMRLEYERGGFAEVIAGLREQIRVLNTRLATESAEKVKNLNTMDFWRKKAIELGYSRNAVIDLETGEIT